MDAFDGKIQRSCSLVSLLGVRMAKAKKLQRLAVSMKTLS